ncbi:DUF1707 domain-containing protein [Nonomuraea antimicrobica]|uniref:DUF1707 domain-containing protein n=1 Tax=Nonomuraea antimicrobica TaxID=561173 RepID=A0ABP7AXP0_9ACTN
MSGVPGFDRLDRLDRERAVALVQQAYADGRLGPAELDQRLELALTATSSQELEPVVSDLPHDDHGDEVLQIASIGGRVTRTGDWLVPRRLRVESEYGRVLLDLSRAHIPFGQIDIELRLTYGHARVVLPAGASANTDAVHAGWHGVVCRAPSRPRPGTLHVQVSGELTYGRLTIRTTRR